MDFVQSSWRGRFLNTRKDARGKYMSLIGQSALLYVPVNVLENANYRVTVEVKRESGNGFAFCNIYGNKNFDFPHAKIECSKPGWCTYDIDLSTKSFPKTVPMMFRIWRNKSSTGVLSIRRITVQLLEGPKSPTPKLISVDKSYSPISQKDVTPIQHKRHKIDRFGRKVLTRRQRRLRRAASRASTPRRISRLEAKALATPPPKLLPIVIGEDNIKVSVIISAYNRRSHFERSLLSYANQTLPKEEFEIIVVDDKSTQDIEGLCRKFATEYKMKFQYILFDRYKGAITPKAFTPALSNNLGFKSARGSVVIITGPETIQKETNLEKSWSMANEGRCVYGSVYRSSTEFVDLITENDEWKSMSFKDFFSTPGARHNPSPLRGFWWYYMAVRKEHVMAINGVDERYVRGITAEDDNFAHRMAHSGVPLIQTREIVGIHQDHSREDKTDLHAFRFNQKTWRSLREYNIGIFNEWFHKKDAVANRNINWGNQGAIIKKVTF